MNKIKIGSAQGFWGDYQDGALRQAKDPSLDYIVMDYLAEVTMAILQKQKSKNPKAGYPKDFVQVVEDVLPYLIKNDIKLIANAGGINPEQCKKEIEKVIKASEYSGVKVGVVSGDDFYNKINDFYNKGISFENIDTGNPFTEVKDKVTTANAYMGAQPLVEALEKEAQIIITGRVTDPAMILAPLMYEFGWKKDEYDLLAAGTVAGHMLECGAQATGGNFLGDWEKIDFKNIGFPIAEVDSKGNIVITKNENLGGIVTEETVKEQLVYEIMDPENYLSADVTVDFTTISVNQVGTNRVSIKNCTGSSPTDYYKVSMNYEAGYKAEGTITYTWPEPLKKAKRADEIIRYRIDKLNLDLDAVRTEFLGYNGCHEGIAKEIKEELNEVVLKIAARSHNKEDLKVFGEQLPPLLLAGPPGVTGIKGRPRPTTILGYWPTLIPKEKIEPVVTVKEVK